MSIRLLMAVLFIFVLCINSRKKTEEISKR